MFGCCRVHVLPAVIWQRWGEKLNTTNRVATNLQRNCGVTIELIFRRISQLNLSAYNWNQNLRYWDQSLWKMRCKSQWAAAVIMWGVFNQHEFGCCSELKLCCVLRHKMWSKYFSVLVIWNLNYLQIRKAEHNYIWLEISDLIKCRTPDLHVAKLILRLFLKLLGASTAGHLHSGQFT